MADLIAPHGGLTEPVCCTVPAGEIDSFKAEAASLPQVPVSAADLSTVYRLGDGTLSPLTGPMNGDVYNRVLEEACIEVNGKKYAWTIPLALPVTSELAGTLSSGQKVALTCPEGEI
ncbi:MAG: sulfate adenylyltransferase, partial [Gimesia chilikensis]